MLISLQALQIQLVFILCSSERAEADGPGQPGGPEPGRGGGGGGAVGARQPAQEVPARTQPQDGVHGGEAHHQPHTERNPEAPMVEPEQHYRIDMPLRTILRLSCAAFTYRRAVVDAFQTRLWECVCLVAGLIGLTWPS